MADSLEIQLREASLLFSQNSDCCAPSDLGSDIKISMIDAGGGHYTVIETERWAMDKPEDLIKLLEYAKTCLDWFNKDDVGDGTA